MNKNKIEISLGVRLRQYRENYGWSQNDLATRLGVKVITVHRWENGTAKPSSLAAQKLQELGFTDIKLGDTNIDTIPVLKQQVIEGSSIQDIAKKLYTTGCMSIHFGNKSEKLHPSPYVVNGPTDQKNFLEGLITMQEIKTPPEGLTWEIYRNRLSLVQTTGDEHKPTFQFLLEKPKQTATSWNSNYGSHGWHRYVGRFPPHLVRALINYFGASSNDVVFDPFVGSGTTLVECRLLGIPSIGIEICPLSALISRTKSQFPESSDILMDTTRDLEVFYKIRWDSFIKSKPKGYTHNDVLVRQGNDLESFSNYEKWLTPEAFLGISIVLEFAAMQTGYARDAILVALSAKMRSIGNVDVDVVRAEYSKSPRVRVDVLKLIRAQLLKMANSITDSVKTHKPIIGDNTSIKVIENNILEVDLPEGSISYVITSPPYGVEAISYIRTHLLSYRCLAKYLEIDPYKFNHEVIGSEYLPEKVPETKDFSVTNISSTYANFFKDLLSPNCSKQQKVRILMMMKFFEDMYNVACKLKKWVKLGGKMAFVIGNKKIDNQVIPTDQIMKEIFEECGFSYESSINHKLKTNNSNSQVPWQERIIQDEYIMFFQRSDK